MDEVERARELLAQGNHRAAINLLKPAAIRDRPPFAKRRALAELYRQLGAPDQAGRWGIVIDGWTTPRERDRLARLLAASGVGRPWRRAFLDLPTDIGDPADLSSVFDLGTEYRSRANARHASLTVRATPSSNAARSWAAFIGGLAALQFLVALLIVYGIALGGGDSDTARVWAGGTLSATLVLLGASTGLLGWSHILVTSRVRGAAYLTLGAALAVLGILVATSIFST
ncbi:hypothetical protein ARHIZOSPH14_25430 [Agromyces rhizosphaerae]|uniref:Uncharacterized protein n=1 Tax=Agromyces rhizosphaerae TaxID=88374 RepID=A0A9W6CSR3_9MICO|nr:hypothetical protein [Agromyces rhizosphaerae]GLI28301.1 hypothetical protein ARHIZOSPH14_25430 [Agromyces rhizosphaerae]